MAKYYVKKLNGKLSQRNTNKKTRRTLKNVQYSKPRINVASNKKIEKEQIPKLNVTTGKKMQAPMKTFYAEKEKQQAEIKLAIDGYKSIIKTVQDIIKLNTKKMDEFNFEV